MNIPAEMVIEDAPLDVLPEVLIDPPWEKEARKPKPARAKAPAARVVPGLEPPSGHSIVWADGEREQWAAVRSYSIRPSTDIGEIVHKYVADSRRVYPPTQATIFATADAELVRPLLKDWRLHYVTPRYGRYLKPIVARFGMEARAAVLHAAGLDTGGCGEALLPFLDAEVVRLMADARFRLKSAQEFTQAYFAKHGLAAVPFLVPDALGGSRPARRKALAALWLIADADGLDSVVEAARPFGDEAVDALDEALRAERPVPEAQKTKSKPDSPKPPKLPWLDVGALPRPVLRDGGGALPVGATGNLVSLLALAGGRRAPELEEIFKVCDRASLTAFSWAIFEAWRAAREPSRNNWVLHQLGRLGDDETVRRLTPIIRVWPGRSGHHKAVLGLGVLKEIGTDVALMHLNGIAQKVKFTGLRDAARRAIAAVARERGLSTEQLADRLVPDFGLDADGGLTLDYGPRRFRVAFDEQLRPYVTGDDGKIRKTLPKPGAKDDPELAPAAHQRFAALKKDVRTAASDQIHRLEWAMVSGPRTWTSAEFRTYLAGHPLLRHIARRLVWQSSEHFFRIAEDGTLADVHDNTFTLPEDALVWIPHPLRLREAGELSAWTELFADYEILQPFPQLGRPVHELTDEERAASHLTRFDGVKVPTGKVQGLTRYGWERGPAQDGGVAHEMALPFQETRENGRSGWIVLDLDPGIAVGAIDVLPEQTIRRITIGTRTYSDGSNDHGLTFGALHPVMASEILAQLADLAGT